MNKILTWELVEKLGYDKVEVITEEMLKGYNKIGKYAFYGCNSLTSITIPNNVTSIGDEAFYGCHNLTSVIIPNSVANIESSAFEDCSSLISVNIGNGVTSIRGYTFFGCSSLTSITIPNKVTSIGSYAFYNCSSLTSITIPNSVTSIGGNAFYGCSKLIDKFFKNKKYDEHRRLIAYKGFNKDMTCRDFKYKKGKTYEIEEEPVLCKHGFHACLNSLDCFNYYYYNNCVYHEVYLEDVSDERKFDTKVVARKITIGKKVTLKDMIEKFNEIINF